MAYRVAFYCRVSTDDQTNENQSIALTALASANGWDVVHTFADTVSGRRDDRTQLAQYRAAGYSKRECARRLRVSHSTLGRLERRAA